MAQHYWLTQRAITLQATCFNSEIVPDNPEKQLALYLRYQTTHDRAFHKSLDKLLKLGAEKRKQEIGFESQKQKQADQTRREAAENRKQHMHRIDVLLAEAKLDHQLMQTIMLRLDDAAAACEKEEEEQEKSQPISTPKAA